MSRKTSPNSLDAKLQRLEKRHRELLVQLAGIGLVLRGSVCARRSRCGTATCHCHRDPKALHGPYPTWTRKVRQKTATVALRPDQVERFAAWTRNMRSLDRTVKALQKIGLRAAEAVRSAEAPLG